MKGDFFERDEVFIVAGDDDGTFGLADEGHNAGPKLLILLEENIRFF